MSKAEPKVKAKSHYDYLYILLSRFFYIFFSHFVYSFDSQTRFFFLFFFLSRSNEF